MDVAGVLWLCDVFLSISCLSCKMITKSKGEEYTIPITCNDGTITVDRTSHEPW